MISDKSLLIKKLAKPPKGARSLYWVFFSKNYMCYIYNHVKPVLCQGNMIACEAIVIDLRYMTTVEDMLYARYINEDEKRVDENTTTTYIEQTMRDTRERILELNPNGLSYAGIKETVPISIEKIEFNQYHPTQWSNQANAYYEVEDDRNKKKTSK